MASLRGSCKFFLASLLLLASTLPAQTQWYAVQTRHLVAYSEGDDRAAREAARRSEGLITIFSQILHRRDIHFVAPLCIIAGPAGAKNPPLVRTPVGNYVSADPARTESWSEAAKAIATLILDDNYPRAQPWFDHGIAGYMAGVRMIGEQIELGGAPPGMAPPTAEQWIPLSRLFAINVLPEPSPEFRAESWAVVRWIIGNGRQAQAGAFLEAVQARGASPEQAVNESFLLSIDDLDREVRESLGKSLSQKFEASRIDERLFAARKVPPADAEVIRRNLKLFSGSDQELKRMVAFMRENQDNASVHRSLAWAYMLRGDQENAIEHIRRALALNDGFADMHYLYARWVNEGDENAIRIQSAAPRMSTELKDALRHNPNYAPALELLGLVELNVGEVKMALADLQHAAALHPRQSRYYMNIAAAVQAEGNTEAARNLLLYARGGDDPAVSSEASTQLEQLGKEVRKRKQWEEMGVTSSKKGAPAEKPSKYDNLDEAVAAEERAERESKSAAQAADTRKIEHLSGTLLSADCATAPQAMLSVSSDEVVWKLHVADRAGVLLIGADQFDCNWHNQAVSVNYKQSGKQQGDIVSLEIR